MKKLLPILIVSGALLLPNMGSAETKPELPVRMLIYGHAYNEDKNSPLNNMRVYLTKNGEEI